MGGGKVPRRSFMRFVFVSNVLGLDGEIILFLHLDILKQEISSVGFFLAN